MTDYASTDIPRLIKYVKEFGDADRLASHIRAGGEITPELRNLIANVIANPKAIKQLSIAQSRKKVRDIFVIFKNIYFDLLTNPEPENWEVLRKELLKAGITKTPEKLGERTKAAKVLTAQFCRITPHQLDVILTVRQPRSKNLAKGK